MAVYVHAVFDMASSASKDPSSLANLYQVLRGFQSQSSWLLPTMCGGIFRDVHRGMSTKHSFFHRLTAVVGR